MNKNTVLVPVLALFAVTTLVACDKDDHKDVAESASTGSESGGETDAATEGEDESGTTSAEELPCDEAHFQDARPCTGGGTEFCAYDFETETYLWGVCVAAPECTNFEDQDCLGCTLDAEGVPHSFDDCQGGTSTPLVLSFDGAAVEYGTGGHNFDLGRCEMTDWPTARTPWLALDRDRSGVIDGGHELFGSATVLRSGSLADNGFTALAELDADHDGKITPADPRFADLVLWSDDDADRRSSGLELQSLATIGLVEIELGYASDRRCDARANCEVERASFTWRDGLGRSHAGTVIDVHLACQ